MSKSINRPRGTNDIYGKNADILNFITNVINSLMQNYQVNPIYVPIFEKTELFVRNIGDTSDIVNKELYTFLDRKKRSLSLRPEGTVGVIRAVLENKLYSNYKSPLKYYYFGPMFRYERPQSGRQRQFYQFGVEYINIDNYFFDIEIIQICVNFFKALKLKNISLHINNLGSIQERHNYSNNLRTYFNNYIDQLCHDCKERIKKNPIRILDCKIDKEKKIFQSCPKIDDFISSKSKKYFSEIQLQLKELNISFVVDNNIVRGLDYYSDFVFEFISNYNNLTLLGGGRYTGISEELKGPNLPSIGFAAGIERIIDLFIQQKLQTPKFTKKIYVFIENSDLNNCAIFISYILRLINIPVEVSYTNKKSNLKKTLRNIKNSNYSHLIILTIENFKKNILSIKNLKTKKQEEIQINKLVKYFQ